MRCSGPWPCDLLRRCASQDGDRDRHCEEAKPTKQSQVFAHRLAATDFSAAVTRSAPMRAFHLSYTATVACERLLFLGGERVTVTPLPSISFSSDVVRGR